MEKNYYEILEISRNASSEIIEKAYKTLAKKYHPDLQEGDLKIEYEQKLKLINEAYDILSDNDKKSKYDQELAQIEAREKAVHDRLIKQQAFNNNQINKNNIQKQYVANQNKAQAQAQVQNQEPIHQTATDSNNLRKQAKAQEEYNRKINAAVNKAYHDAYIQDLKNRGYKIRYKKTLKDYLTNLLSLLILICIFVVLWQIPFIRRFFINMYNDNPFLKVIVDIFINLFKH